MSKKIIETISKTSSVITVDKTPAEKAWEKRRKNLISALLEKLSKSISSSAHNQWMTKKNNEIADLKRQLAELKSKEKN